MSRQTKWYNKRILKKPIQFHGTFYGLNMHQYLWICLNIIENAWINCPDYVRALNMHDHFICSIGFWKCLEFLRNQGSQYGTVVLSLNMQGLRRVPNMSDYGSKCLKNASICVNIPQYAWTWLNIAECPWIYLNKLF